MRLIVEDNENPKSGLIDLIKVDNDRATRGGGRASPIEPGIIARAIQGIKYTITGVSPATWFGPQQPLSPVAPPETKGRTWDYPVGYNLFITKRPYEGLSFELMRGLADNYDILRLVIETRKDQIARMKWRIKHRPGTGSNGGGPGKPTKEAQDHINQVMDFMVYPDQEHNWDQWLRIVLEDMLVIDAACIYPRKTRGGQPYAFEPIDGATITRKINSDGRTPEPPDVAYQQILKGLPAVDFSRDDLVYFPRNLRSNHVYGFGPVEQIIRTVNIGLRRLQFQIDYYREGNIPEALIGVPKEWTIDQIAQFQAYWDDILEGNLAQRRHAKFVPGDMKFQETKAPPLKDEFDEWLARVVCYALSVSPQPFVREMNRATAQSSSEMAQQEGLEPLLKWSKNLIDLLIWKYFQFRDVTFEWEEEVEPDALKQAQINQIYVTSGIMTEDEVRASLGFDPLAKEAEPNLLSEKKPKLDENGNPIEEGDPGKKSGEKPGEKEGLERMAKRKKKALKPIDRERPSILKGRREVKKMILSVFEKGKKEAKKLEIPLQKRSIDDIVAAILDDFNFNGWMILTDGMEEVLEKITKDGVYQALLQLGLSSENMTNKMNEKAFSYAKDRAAELVGKKWVKGKLADNPNPKYAITDSTREFLRADITKAIEEGWGPQKLADAIEENYAFSAERAEAIARTELAFADSRGNAIAYKDSGVVSGKEWILGSEHADMDECDEAAAAGVIPLDDIFPGVDVKEPPAHPRCVCDFLPTLSEED
jgi:hypothetical protein